MSYKVQFLNDDEFERLPAQNIQNKVGVAYPESGEAYVRRTGIPVVDAFTLAHELEHLDGDSLGEHYDSKNQCYYKDTGQWLQTAAPFMNFIPGIGTVASMAAGAAGGKMHANNVAKTANSQMLDQQRAQQGMMGQFQTEQPQVNQSPNVIQGASGTGSGGGPGGSPGGVGGGAVSKLKQFLQSGNQGNAAGGMF